MADDAITNDLINNILAKTGDDLLVKAYTIPPEQSNLIEFISTSKAFVLDMERSTIYNILLVKEKQMK